MEIDNSVTIHQRSLQIYATKIFKVKKQFIVPELITEIFEIKEPHYKLRSEANHFKIQNLKCTHYGIQSVEHLGPKIWNIVSQNIRESNSLNELKSLMKFENLILRLVDFVKTTLLKWVLFDLIYIETICLSFPNQFF